MTGGPVEALAAEQAELDHPPRGADGGGLAHSTLPYSFAAHGEEPVPVRCELLAPDGSTWRLGLEGAPVVITGSVVDFCRVGAQRLPLEEADLGATGAAAERVLARLRNFAI